MSQIDLVALLDSVEPGLRRRYLEAMTRLRARNELGRVQAMVNRGRFDEAIAGLEEAAEEVSGEWAAVFLFVARAAAEVIRAASPSGFNFDVAHARTQGIIRGMERDLVTRMRADANRLVTEDLVSGRGTISRTLVDSLGLGVDQARQVRAYREGMVPNPRAAARQEWRGGPPRASIPPSVAERMASGLRTRLRLDQSTRVGTWLGQLAVQLAVDDALRQGVEFGALRLRDIRRTWVTREDDLVRMSHDPMHGQERGLDQAFDSGAGNRLMYPGDPSAPAKDTRGCRCGLLIHPN